MFVPHKQEMCFPWSIQTEYLVFIFLKIKFILPSMPSCPGALAASKNKKAMGLSWTTSPCHVG